MRPRLIIAVLFLAPCAFSVDRHAGAEPLSATGRTGPLDVELSLRKSRVKIGQSLFVKTILKNLSKKPLLVTEWIFRGSDDLGAEWSKNSDVKIQTYVEIVDPTGNALKPALYGLRPHVNPFEITISTPDAEESRLLAIWKTAGLDDKEIDARYRKFALERIAVKRDKKYPLIHLPPGGSIQSASWCSGTASLTRPAEIICPGNGYAELPFFIFEHPGIYRIRAVRDFRLGKDLRKYEDEWCVKVATKWIAFEVTR